MNTKQIGYLQKLCNKYGDFKVARAYKKKDGTIIWTKHKSVLECWESENGIWFLGQVNNRQILPYEVVLDLDENPTKEKMNEKCDMLEEEGMKYKAYHTGSKGYHIHIIRKELKKYPEHLKKQLKEVFLEAFNADLHKASSNVMIALENAPHWKTGKIKRLVRTNIK